MRSTRVNQASSLAIIVFSVTALAVVLWAVHTAALTDEGTGAPPFSTVGRSLYPVTLVYLITADWSQPWRSARPIAIAVATTTLAFAALFYLEHVYSRAALA